MGKDEVASKRQKGGGGRLMVSERSRGLIFRWGSFGGLSRVKSGRWFNLGYEWAQIHSDVDDGRWVRGEVKLRRRGARFGRRCGRG